MKEIYYIGAFYGADAKFRENTNANPAGTMKMTFIIQALKKLGYKVIVVSIASDNAPGFHILEEIPVDDRETHVYVPYVSFSLKGKICGKRSVEIFLKRYLTKVLKKTSTVVSYHSLAYGKMLSDLHRKIGFRWCPQIEEIYCLSRGELFDADFLRQEEKMFEDGDGYLFVNDLLPQKYAKEKPYAVSYGNYQVYSEKNPAPSGVVNMTYTGIINDDRGAFLLLESMKYLPSQYRLNILGFGTEKNMNRFYDTMARLNAEFGEERIRFFGTKSGKDYSEFLIHNQIGISLMDDDVHISTNAFPSKIMSYLGHCLYVVSSKTASIVNSKVADVLYFCDNEPQSIADAILSVPLQEENRAAEKLQELEKDFIRNLEKVIEG